MKTTFKLSSGSAAADDYCAEENGQGDSQWHKSRNRISLKISQIEYSGDQAQQDSNNLRHNIALPVPVIANHAADNQQIYYKNSRKRILTTLDFM